MKVPLLTLPEPDRGASDDGRRAIESFSPIKQYVIAGVLIVLAALIAVNWISARAERGIVISRLQDESITPAEVATFSIVEQVSLRSGAGSVTDTLQDLAWMDRTVLNAVVGQPVARVDIVGHSGEVLYSTDHEQIGQVAPNMLAAGSVDQSIADYVEAVDVRGLDGEAQQIDAVKTFVPVFQEASAGSMGEAESVFVVYRDVTSGVATATSANSRFRTITIVGVMVVMFAALLLVVARGHVFARAARARLEALLNREKSLRAQLDVRNEELKTANEAKTRFLSVVTHELNTPLTSILAFADLLKRNRLGSLSERDIQQVEAISRNGHQMGMLIRDLLDLSRIESGTMTLETSSFDIAECLDNVAESMGPIVRDRSQSLVTELSDGQIKISADQRRIEQVITNLLSNASKYSPPGSDILLSIERCGDSIDVTVQDKGIGIGSDDLERLFTPFFRAQNEETRRLPGTGLGLVICRQIAELHGGSMEIESERGAGTMVRFRLPITSTNSGSAEAAA